MSSPILAKLGSLIRNMNSKFLNLITDRKEWLSMLSLSDKKKDNKEINSSCPSLKASYVSPHIILNATLL